MPKLGKKVWTNVKRCKNLGIVPLVSMVTKIRELKTCLQKGTPVFNLIKHAYIVPHIMHDHII